MKNKVEDVRNHLVAMMEALGDKDADAMVVERAKVMSQVAGAYLAGVKVEIDAIRLFDDTSRIPDAVATPELAGPRLRAINGK